MHHALQRRYLYSKLHLSVGNPEGIMKLLTKKRVAIAAGVIVVGGAAAAWLAPKGEP
jgi:hypothetical protein